MKPLDVTDTGVIGAAQPTAAPEPGLDHAVVGANQAAAPVASAPVASAPANAEIPSDQAVIDVPLPQLPADLPPIEPPEFVLARKISDDTPATGTVPAGLPGLGGGQPSDPQDILGGLGTEAAGILDGANVALGQAAQQAQESVQHALGQAGAAAQSAAAAATQAAQAAATQLPTLPSLPADPVGALMQGLQVPALPGVDVLFKPILDLLSSFGTGVLGALDPTAILSQSSQIIETAMQVAKGSMATVEQVWEGQAARQAQVAGQEASAQGQETSQRGFDISELTQRAAAVVQQGNAQLLGIASSFATQATALAPVILTPPGQATLIASATEHLGSALTVVNATRGDLAGKTAELNGVVAQLLGQSGLPAPQEVAQAAVQNIGEPLLSQAQDAATQAASASPTAGTPGSSLTPTQPSALNTQSASTPSSGLLGALGRPGGSGGSGGSGGGGGRSGSPGITGLPSTQSPGSGSPGAGIPGVRPVTATPTGFPTGTGTSTTPAGTGSSFMGSPAAAGAGRQGDDDEHSRTVQPYQSLTGNDDLTGPLGESTPEVIGATHTDELLGTDYEQDQF
ncbi:hypothetical protein [Nocardia farcinica]|uniref:hypothetical protein n=1 Tax=Nocardia farcinica TaxID=37329 RepID=UPI0018942FD1|nr:hypothetical protein [Nocardia farcinica]MBF6068727.1 hypothetical protein [Nocardia farcinica]